MRLIAFVVGTTGRAVVCSAAFALVAGSAAGITDDSSVHATIYQWTDAEGTFRYTPDLDRIPRSARDTVLTIQSRDEAPGDTPIYFEPDPRANEVAVPEPGGASPAPTNGDARSDRIRVLEAEIAQDEDALKAFISQPGNDSDAEIPPELREIADRLPRLQAELAALQGRTAGAGVP